MSEKQTPLAIVGIGCLFPKARDAREFWANIKHRVDGITEVPASHWSPSDYFDADKAKPDMTYARRGGFLSPVEFDAAEFGISPNTLEATDPAQLLGLVAAQMALRDAGYGPEKEYDRSGVSVILGVTGTLELVVPLGARLGHPVWRKALKDHGIEGAAAESIVESIKDGYVPWQENSFPGLLGNVVAGRIANRFNLGGTNCVVDAACGSSLSAAHLAALELETGRSRMVITGGVDCFNDIFMYMCFSKTPALSATGDSKPFDKKADGTILGEGLGMLVFKRLEDAQADGDRIYAVLKGIGSSSDGRGKSIYAPSAEGQAKALKRAYEIAGVSPETVELVEAHGTGTSVGDGVEVSALTGVYREAKADGQWCALGSVKSMIGHTKAAAGSAAMIKAALALYHKVLPPTIKVNEPLAVVEGSPFYVNTLPRPWLRKDHPRRAACSALGFGGANFHAVLEEADPNKPDVDWDNRTVIGAISASSSAEIATKLSSWAKTSSWDEVRVAAQQSCASFKAADAARLCFVVEKDKTDLPKLIAGITKALANGSTEWVLPDGAFFSSGACGSLGVLFAGQGSQYVGMNRDLSCQFPEALETLASADAAFNGEGRLSDIIYPAPAFGEDRKSQQEAVLRSTDVAQPALGSVALAQWKVLRRFGLKAEAYAGHSYGELAALTAAGRLSEGELHALSGLRGRLMKKGDGGRGGMLAVAAPLAEVEAVLKAEKLDVVLANKNAPKQTVLSGDKAQIARAAEAYAARGVKTVTLPVSAAFHSPLVASAVPEFRAALEKAAFPAGAAPVYANKTAQPYPADAASCRDLLASQLESPVEFTAMIERLHAAGVTRLIELGPGARLASLVGQILEGKTFSAAALDSSNGKRHGAADLARLLGQLAAWGFPVKLDLWDGGAQGVSELTSKKKAKMPVALTGAGYRSSKPAPRQLVKMAAPVVQPAPAHGAPSAAPANDALIVLQRLQEQTAKLHEQFLQNQLAVAKAFEALVTGQVSAAPVLEAPRPAYVPPAPAPVVVAAPAPAASPVQETVLAVVAEKTGYPVETLNLDMDLESDLGIDSIKRVEIMSALAQKLPGAPKAKPEHLGTLRTLRKIVEFVSMGKAQGAETPKASAVATGSIEPIVLSVVAEKTGYPVETLNLDMDLESDLGIDSIKRVEIMSALGQKLPEAPKAKPEHLGTLRTLRKIVEFVSVGKAQGAEAPKAGAVAADSVEPIVLAVVAEKTGYPVETLNLDMDLESDLGIDSIKRVEIMSALAGRLPDAPKAKPEHLGTLRTLRKMTEFLSAGGAPRQTAPAAAVGATTTPVETVVVAVVAEKTGYPAETLNLDMDLEADLGIDSIKRVEIMSALAERIPGAPKAKPEHLGTLRTLRKIVEFVGNGERVLQTGGGTASKDSDISPLSRLVLRDGPLEGERKRLPLAKGELVVTGDTQLGAAVAARLGARFAAIEDELPANLAGLIIIAPARRLGTAELWTDESERFARSAFLLATKAAKALSASAKAGGALFCTVSRLDGTFACNGLVHEEDPISGALAGLAKTAGKEWAGVACKAIDAADLGEALAERLAAEIMLAGPDEVGLTAQGARALLLEERPSVDAAAPFGADDVVLVTGGARGVTAAAALALAKSCKPTLALWGRSALPAPEAPETRALTTENELKRQFASQGLKPKEIGERCRRLLGDREILATLKALEAAGSKTVYQSVDVRDGKAVAAALAELQARHGKVRGLVHGAGVLADKKLEDKTLESFDAVWATKVTALRHILNGLELSALKGLVLFSSSTARYGRLGQGDYAMANEALNKTARLLSRRLPKARVCAIGWGPWDGGMVTDSLKPLFAAEGVGLIGLQAGGELMVSELSEGSRAVELVVLGRGAGAAAPAAAMTAALERVVSLEEFPFLSSHALNGRAVLPTAVMAEMLAHAALHGQPGLRFAGFDDLRVLKGVLLGAGQSKLVRALAGKAFKKDGFVAVPVELQGEKGERHASATALLSAKAAAAGAPAAAPAGGLPTPKASELYGETLFHGAEMRFVKDVTALAQSGIVVDAAGALPPKQWLRRPWRDRWVADPAALDAAFQAMIVWTTRLMGAPSLPSFLGKYRQFDAFPAQGVSVRCAARAGEGTAAADIDFVDAQGRLVARLEGYECTVDGSLREAFMKKEAIV